MSQTVNPDFLFAGEGIYDWQFEVYHLSYHRSWDKRHLPLSRYMLPQMPLMTAISGFNDRNMINQCLLYRYIMSYEPYNFKGRLDDFPLTMIMASAWTPCVLNCAITSGTVNSAMRSARP